MDRITEIAPVSVFPPSTIVGDINLIHIEIPFSVHIQSQRYDPFRIDIIERTHQIHSIDGRDHQFLLKLSAIAIDRNSFGGMRSVNTTP